MKSIPESKTEIFTTSRHEPGEPVSNRCTLFLRSLSFTIVWFAFTPLWACICFATCWLPYRKRYHIVSRWNVFTIWLLKSICGIHYQVRGMENLPDGPAILLSKHQSAWETIFFLYHMPRPLSFVLKKELQYIPFFGWTLALLRMIPINRRQGTNAFRQLVKKGSLRLREKHWIIIFPEGTRIPVGQKGKYHNGGSRLAIKTGAAIVPIAVNAGECWPKNTFIKKPGLITVSIGKAISPENRTPDDLMHEVENWIENEMRQISPHAYR